MIIYVYVCTYINAYIYIYIYIYAHTYIHVVLLSRPLLLCLQLISHFWCSLGVHTHIHSELCICMYVCVYVHIILIIHTYLSYLSYKRHTKRGPYTWKETYKRGPQK